MESDNEDVIEELLSLAQDSASTFRVRLKEILKERDDLKRRLEEDDDLHFQLDPAGFSDEGESKEEYLYESKDVVLSSKATGNKEVEDSASKKLGSKCFNCDDFGHILSECPEPKNHRKISANRKEYNRTSETNSQRRYHLDAYQKFSHIRPGGVGSAKLRRALALSPDQLPSWVYKMRILGYPPGWLKEAQISSSGVRLYAENGRDLGGMEEEGEVSGSFQYDTSKLITWAGFNENIDKHSFRDETSIYRVPPIKSQDLMSEMIIKIKPLEQKSYVRGKMQDTHVSTKRKTSPEPKEDGQSTPKVQKLSVNVKEMTEGTPIVTLYSSFQSLPTVDKWAKDTTDHILFENLPDYTGKWDKLLGVIKRGRESLSKVNADDS